MQALYPLGLFILLVFLNAAYGGEIAYKENTLTFAVETGRSLSARVRTPVGDHSNKRLPVLLVFGGFQDAAQVLDKVRPKEPIILASFDYPFSLPRKFKFPESLKDVPAAKQMIHETLLGIRELRRTLATLPDVDPSRISILGASLGAPFAVIAGAEDPGFAGVIIVHGFGDIAGTIHHQFVRKWEPKYGLAAYPPSWTLAQLVWFYADVTAPEEAARYFGDHQRVLMVSAEKDQFVPAHSTEVLWKAIDRSKAKRHKFTTPGDHLQPGSERLIGQILDRVTGWMIQERLL